MNLKMHHQLWLRRRRKTYRSSADADHGVGSLQPLRVSLVSGSKAVEVLGPKLAGEDALLERTHDGIVQEWQLRFEALLETRHSMRRVTNKGGMGSPSQGQPGKYICNLEDAR